jgi:hypothetical protein
MVYDFLDYRDYLGAWIENHVSGGYGLRKKIAEHLGCQSAFVSQVLHKITHFLLYQRAGSDETRKYFQAKIDAVHKSRLVLKNRVYAKDALSSEDKARYYSAWYYGAIRLLVTIPAFQKKDDIIAKLRLSPQTVSEALSFLVKTGLIAEKNGHYLPSELHLHLGNDSALISKHHTNWRLQAMNAITEEKNGDLHYSLAVTLSKEDIIRVKARMVDWIEELQATVRPSPSESLCGFCLDWFEI